MLHEEVKKYRELSGDTNPNTPISRIGGYLDGYEKALEQKTGHWIAHSDGGIWIKYYECSKCGKIHDTQSNYCEKCGIRMVEPQAESEDNNGKD